MTGKPPRSSFRARRQTPLCGSRSETNFMLVGAAARIIFSFIVTRSKAHYLSVWVTAIGLTGLSLIAHVTSPSSFHQPEENWESRVITHQTHPAFRVRPVTTGLVAELHRVLGWPYKTAFFALQFLLMLVCGPVFYHFLRRFGFADGYAMGGMIIFYFSLPVFMAHFDPVYTWDDFWVYLMIPLSFLCMSRKYFIMAALALAWAMLARETSVIFVPIWFLFARDVDNGRLARPIVYTLLALILVGCIRVLLSGPTAQGEFRLGYNFAYPMRISDTVFSLLVSLGALWPVGIYQICSKSPSPFRFLSLFRWGAATTGIGFVVVTLLFALARETRLFFPPFVFFIPLALLFIRDHAETARTLWRRVTYGPAMAGVIGLSAVSVVVTMAAFPVFDFRTWHDGNRLFFSLHLTAAGLAGIVHWYHRRRSRGMIMPAGQKPDSSADNL